MKRRGDSGQVLPLIAICLTVIMGFAGMSVDVSYLEYHQRQQQSATDAAALGGAQQLIYSNCASSSAATTAAENDSASNGYTNGANNVTVTVSNPPTTGPYAGNGCAVTVAITATKVSTFFTRLFGHASETESTQATGLVTANSKGCFYALSTGTSTTYNGDNVTAPGCGFLINDTATFNGDPKFDAGSIGYAGGAPIENGTTFTAATPAPMLKVANPCPEITGCAYITANPPSTAGCTSYSESSVTNLTVPSGCYSSFLLNGDVNVTMSGTYVFTGSATINGVTNLISGPSGVTLYVAAGGQPPIFNGVGNATLSAPTSGNYAGVLYYQVPSNTSNPTFNGINSMSLSGLVYAPGASDAVFNGTNGGYLVVVVGAATFNGSNAYDLASPPPNGSLIKSAVLGE